MASSTNNTYDEQTQELLRQAKDDLHKIDIQMNELKKQRELLDKEVQALEMSLTIYLRRSGREPSPGSEWAAILSNCETHNERIKAIAEHEGGEISVSEVTDILFNSGLMGAAKRNSAYVGIYNRMKQLEIKGDFKRVGTARYRLANR